MGGYNMAMVDEFLDELTDDYTALYKENAALKAKMKVLVEKVEEYRATEDSMRATLLTAQRMADSIVKEAEEKRDQILAQAESGAKERAAACEQELAASQSRLRQGQQDLAQFIAASRELCDRQIKFLDQLPQLPVEVAAPVEEHPVEEIEEKVMASFEQTVEEKPAEEAPKAAAVEYPEGDPFAPKQDLDATRRVNLDDLKFGRNYNSEN
jgi:cell division initiation protein